MKLFFDLDARPYWFRGHEYIWFCPIPGLVVRVKRRHPDPIPAPPQSTAASDMASDMASDTMVGEKTEWWVIHGEDFAEAMRRAAAGEDPDLLYVEYAANSERDEP